MPPLFCTMDRPSSHTSSPPAATAQTELYTASSPKKPSRSPHKVPAFPMSRNVLMFRSYSPWMDHRNQSGHLPFLDPPTRYRRLNRRTDPSRTRRLRPSSWNTSHPRSKSRKDPSVPAHKQPRRAPSGWIPMTTRMTFYNMSSSGVFFQLQKGKGIV